MVDHKRTVASLAPLMIPCPPRLHRRGAQSKRRQALRNFTQELAIGTVINLDTSEQSRRQPSCVAREGDRMGLSPIRGSPHPDRMCELGHTACLPFALTRVKGLRRLLPWRIRQRNYSKASSRLEVVVCWTEVRGQIKVLL